MGNQHRARMKGRRPRSGKSAEIIHQHAFHLLISIEMKIIVGLEVRFSVH